MRFLTFIFFLSFYSSIISQITDRHIYRDASSSFVNSHLLLDHENNVLLYSDGGNSKSITALDENENWKWNLHVNIIAPAIYKQKQHFQMINISSDSSFLFASDRVFEANNFGTLLLRINSQGDTISSKNLKFEENLNLRGMIKGEEDFNYMLLSDKQKSIVIKLNSKDSIVWLRKIEDDLKTADLTHLKMINDSTLYLYGNSVNATDEQFEIVLSMSIDSEINWSKKINNSQVVSTKDIIIDEENIFCLAQLKNDSEVRLSIVNLATDTVDYFRAQVQYSINFSNSLHIIEIVDSLIVFSAGPSIFIYDYENKSLENFETFLELIDIEVVDSTSEFFLVNYVGVLPVLLLSDFGSIGLFRGHNIELLKEDQCIWEGYNSLSEDVTTFDSIQFSIGNFNYEYLQVETVVEKGSIIQKEGCLDPGNSVGNLALKDKVKLYPNPSSGDVQVEIDDFLITKYHISDLAGNLLSESSIINSTELQLNVSDMSPGIYILSLLIEDEIVHKKFVLID